ncbi:hypothetical protein DU474_02680 [Campylobacter novaezeelandiae]|uniref:hypothetical protein n=1 Tax=Campylobacter novaezeelandiae TaxID=2267891 RepID=UPI0010379CFE|nr:hypothetical protein [Campylobacter novaezeelandiae]TBR79881.1 hypothetical protein DU474_02680 [Campylobacter novaezeelandiae]
MNDNVFLLNIQDKINQEDLFNIRMKFEQLQNKKEILSNLVFLKLQDPIKPLIASIISGCLGLGFLALDRFMMKDYILGSLRLVLSLFPCILFLILGTNYEQDTDLSEIFFVFFCIFLICGIIWWGVDLFLVYKKIKKENYNKIMEFIFNYQKI